MKSRSLKWLLYSLLGLGLGYLVTANVLLSSNLIHKLVNSDPEGVLLSYRGAYSILPGVVHLRDVSMRIQDSSIQLHFTLDRATVKVSLVALFLHREFNARRLHADGLSFRLRLRRFPGDIREKHHRSLPAIPGLASFARKPGPPPPPDPNPWRVRLENVHITGIHELWFDEFRFQGNALARGGFYLKPGREAEIGPASLVLLAGKLDVAGVASLDELTGEINVRVRPFLRGQVDGARIVEFTKATVSASGRIDSMRFLDYYMRDVHWLRFDRGRGRLDVDLGIEDGAFLPRSRLAFTSDDLEARLHAQCIRGSGRGTWEVDAEGKRGALALELGRFTMTAHERPEARIEGRALSITVATPDLRLASLFSRLEVKVRVPDARISSLRYFNVYLPEAGRVRFLDGEGRISGELTAYSPDEGRDSGRLVVDTSDARLEYLPYRITGAMRLTAILQNGRTGKRQFDLSGTRLALSDLVATAEPGSDPSSERWWGDVTIRKGAVTIGKPVALSGDVGLMALDARPLLSVFDPGNSIPGLVKSMLAFNDLTASAAITVGPDGLSVRSLRAHGGSNRLEGWLRDGDLGKDGRLLVRYGPFAAGVEVGGDSTRIRLQDAIGWYHRSPRGGAAPEAAE